MYYPLPALLIVSPLALLPVVLARIVFIAISAGLFTFAITRDGYGRLPVLLSISFVTAVEFVQWPMLLGAAMLIPGLGWVAVAKPNLGIAMAAYASTGRSLVIMLVSAVLLTAVSLVVMPNWPAEWLRHIRAAAHFVAPVARPFGFLLLAVLLRWRRPEARLLAALACVPHTPSFYDHVLVFLVPQTSREALSLTVLTFAVYFAVAFAPPFHSYQEWGDFVGTATVLLIYLPAVVMVLRRPNEGTSHYLARLAGRIPTPWKRS